MPVSLHLDAVDVGAFSNVNKGGFKARSGKAMSQVDTTSQKFGHTFSSNYFNLYNIVLYIADRC